MPYSKRYANRSRWWLLLAALLLSSGVWCVACAGNPLPSAVPSRVPYPPPGTVVISPPASSTPTVPAATVTALPSATPTVTTEPSPSATSSSIAPTLTAWAIQRAEPATRLVIPVLDLDAPIVEVPLAEQTWDVSPLTQEIAHLGGTAQPGEPSNMVLAGHVTITRGSGPFMRLEHLAPGDAVIVYAGERAFTYRVAETRLVLPSDVSVVGATTDPILTLVTCAVWDAANRSYRERLVVIAELVSAE